MATQAISAETLPSYNPATGEISESIPKTQPEEIREIIARARVAQEKWRAASIADRCILFDRLRKTILSARNELADTVVR